MICYMVVCSYYVMSFEIHLYDKTFLSRVCMVCMEYVLNVFNIGVVNFA